MNEKSSTLFFLLTLVLLAACGNQSPTRAVTTATAPTTAPAVTTVQATTTPAVSGRPVATPRATRANVALVALLLASTEDDRSRQARDIFTQVASTATTTVQFQDAENDAARQKRQVDEALKQGMQVLVIQPVDQDAAASYVDAAHKAGAMVVAFDRVINTRDLDAYVSFDNFGAGQAQANEAIRVLTANKAKTPWNFVILEGAAGDSISAEITRGYYDVLKSLIDKKQVVVTVDQAHSAASSDQGLKTTQDALNKTNNNIAAVLANNAALANGALRALDAQKLTGKVFVAGTGVDTDSIHALCSGQMGLTSVQEIKPLATSAARLAVALAHGKKVSDTNLAPGTIAVADRPVPFVRVPIQPVTLDSAQAVLVQSGLYTYAQLGKCAPAPVDGVTVPHVDASGKLTIWTVEDAGLYNYIANLAGQFMDANSGVQVQVVNYDADSLRARLGASAPANPPDLIWAPFDIAGDLVKADVVQPVDGTIDTTPFLTQTTTALTVNDKHYGVPVQVSNYLLLYYNKKLLKDAPLDTTALVKLAATLTKADGSQYAMAFNQSESLYLVPWFTGYKGKLLSDDGRTAILNSSPMSDTLGLMKQFKDQKVLPPDSDGETTDTLFRQGKAALVVNGDWAYADYLAALGDSLGVARLPKVIKTGEYPRVLSSGHYLLVAKNAPTDRVTIAKAFVQLVTSRAVQLDMAKRWKHLPALRDAMTDGVITNDPFLKASVDAASGSLPWSVAREFKCVLDAIQPGMVAVLSGKSSPGDAAKGMQDAADTCIGKP